MMMITRLVGRQQKIVWEQTFRIQVVTLFKSHKSRRGTQKRVSINDGDMGKTEQLAHQNGIIYIVQKHDIYQRKRQKGRILRPPP